MLEIRLRILHAIFNFFFRVVGYFVSNVRGSGHKEVDKLQRLKVM